MHSDTIFSLYFVTTVNAAYDHTDHENAYADVHAFDKTGTGSVDETKKAVQPATVAKTSRIRAPKPREEHVYGNVNDGTTVSRNVKVKEFSAHVQRMRQDDRLRDEFKVRIATHLNGDNNYVHDR